MEKWLVLIKLMILTTSCSSFSEHYKTVMSRATQQRVDEVIHVETKEYENKKHAERIRYVSSTFLDTPYQPGTLKGSFNEPEELVIDFDGVDCFTFITYVEALSSSDSEQSFLQNLINTRYVNSKVDYLNRRHFFSDWVYKSPKNAVDVTKKVGSNYITVTKKLNLKPDGSEYIKGLGVVNREISYIPNYEINQSVIDNLQTGDYIGIYSPLQGLDVTHVGIFIRDHNGVWFRNASSLNKNRKVVDSPFMEYMASKPGIVVLRSNKNKPFKVY